MVYLKLYEKPEYNKKEIFRYMGCRDNDERVEAVVDECITEADGKLSYKVCYTHMPIRHIDEGLDLTFMETKSKGLKKNLSDCDEIIIFAATIGLEMDRLIARYGVVSPLKSVAFQAIGAERIESLCDMFENEIRGELYRDNRYIRPRFSAGYGDFDLSAQREFFKVLDCQRKIGLTLNDSLIMSPSKSVTAIIGVSDKKRESCLKGCTACGKTDCEYRSE